jgi:1-acyl-sn-glycerol-3-phosphate acyltransferase
MRRIYGIFWYIVWPFFNLVHPVRLVGRENIPQEGGLYCANHSGYADPLCLMFALGSRNQVRPMAKAELLRLPILGWFLKKVGVFGVERGKADVNAIKTAMRYLKSGENVLMFPEGTRIKDGVDKHGNEGEAKAGAVMLASRTGAPLVPVYIPEKKPWFRRVNVVVGQPYHPHLESRKGSTEEYQALADDLLGRIYALKGQPT